MTAVVEKSKNPDQNSCCEDSEHESDPIGIFPLQRDDHQSPQDTVGNESIDDLPDCFSQARSAVADGASKPADTRLQRIVRIDLRNCAGPILESGFRVCFDFVFPQVSSRVGREFVGVLNRGSSVERGRSDQLSFYVNEERLCTLRAMSGNGSSSRLSDIKF